VYHISPFILDAKDGVIRPSKNQLILNEKNRNANIRRIAMKVVFIVFKRNDLTHEQCLAQWNGERHISIVRKTPGLEKWVQNHVTSVAKEAMPDGVGELWFADAEALEKGMNSPEMAAAVEDAKNFFDMERTYALVLEEKRILG
jgi:uncharacterized protein (TIGR02118 family)